VQFVYTLAMEFENANRRRPAMAKEKKIYYRMRVVFDKNDRPQPDEQGSWQYLAVNEGQGNRPAWLTIAEKEAAKGGRGFQFRYRDGRYSEPIYKTVEEARTMANADSGKVATQVAAAAGIVGSLGDMIDKFLAEVQANKARKTHLSYANSLKMFRESCRKSAINAVDRSDVMAFKLYLKNYTQNDGTKLSARSLFNNFLNTAVFFKWAKRSFKSMGVNKGDWFPKPEREPEAYSTEELKSLFEAADADQRLLLKSFLNTGFRSGEIAHLTYGDIDVRHSIWTVRAKTLNGREWKPKTADSEREVAVDPELTKKIMARKAAAKATDDMLVFPNRDGSPDHHLLRIVKRVAAKAGVTGRVDDHKFRSTAITLWLDAGHKVPDVMAWVGHVDPKTILRYAAKVNLRKAENRAKITGAFKQFSAMGD
jgi:integrase